MPQPLNGPDVISFSQRANQRLVTGGHSCSRERFGAFASSLQKDIDKGGKGGFQGIKTSKIRPEAFPAAVSQKGKFHAIITIVH